MTFVWTDRVGQRHELADPQPIVAEGEAAAREIDRLVGLLDSDDRSIRDVARRQIVPHQAHLDQLFADLERWNGHATKETRAAALDMAGKISSVPALLDRVTLVVDLHEEHEQLLRETAGDPAVRATRLAGPMTGRQARAVAACNSRTPPPTTATCAEAKAWLDGYPQFHRQRPGDGGWFAWTDSEGHAHRLVDPLMIETEMVRIGRDLAGLHPRLFAEADLAALYATVNETGALWERLTNLQYDLERFETEAEALDRTECKAWAADWRSKRKATS